MLSARFSQVPPINEARYQKYPMGDGACLSLIEFIQSNVGLFVDGPTSSGTAGDSLLLYKNAEIIHLKAIKNTSA